MHVYTCASSHVHGTCTACARQGNVDPTVLFGSEQTIKAAVHDNIAAAGGKGKHILNLGHGVLQGTPEEAVAAFVAAAKEM